jgi:tetratricopeptide (TPR) repeat protein
MSVNWLIIISVASILQGTSRSDETAYAHRPGSIDTITCLEHPEQSYCLFRSSPDKNKAPLVVLLDPGGRGSLPLRMYQDLAKKYGYMLACSNNGRNGPPEIFHQALDAMIPDLITRFDPDTGKMVYCGFSGGGREAFLYSQLRHTAGVIACGSGISSFAGDEQLRLPFYIGIAGRKDMNYLEVTEAVERAAQLGTPSWIIAFDGGHSWPDTLTMRRAFDQVEIRWNEMGLIQLSDQVRRQIRRDICCQLDSMLSRGRYHEAISLRSRLMENPAFDREDPCWQEVLSRFPSQHELENAQRTWNKIRKKEKRYQDSVISAFHGIDLALYKQLDHVRPDSWWKSRGKQVRRAMGSEDFLIMESASRMNDFTRNNCMERGYFILDDPQGPEQAARYFRAWCSFDPDSPDAFYWLAIAFARDGLQQEAIDALEKAVSNGLEAEKIEATRAFENLRSDPRYRSLIIKTGQQ